MFTKQQLAKWRSEGFQFDEFHDEVAVEKEDEVSINSVEILNNKATVGLNPKFTVKIYCIPYNHRVEVVAEGKIFSTYRQAKVESITFPWYQADVTVQIPFLRTASVYKVTARIVHWETGKVLKEKTVNVSVSSGGSVRETVEEVPESINVEIHTGEKVEEVTVNNLIAMGLSKKKAEEFHDALNVALKDYNINTSLRISHFLSQVIHESGGFRYTKEQHVSESAYGGFIGRGLMQLTGEDNYESYEEYESNDFTSTLKDKEKIENLPYSVRSASWFWTYNKSLNKYADDNDFIYITRLINGGYNGFNDRLRILKKAFEIFKLKYSDFEFEKSRGYNERRASFAWGLWHDPALDKDGCTKNKDKAIAGYKRFLELTPENFADTNWYQIKFISLFSSLKYTVGRKSYVKVLDVAKLRLEKLNDL